MAGDEINNNSMKKLNRFILAAMAAGAVQTASAVNYSPTHMLLVFRDPAKALSDVIIDIGSVSNYLSLTSGTKVQVSYPFSQVTNNFGGSPNGNIDFLVVAATDTSLQDPVDRVWATDYYTSPTPSDVSSDVLTVMRSAIDKVGTKASSLTTNSATAPFIISPGSVNSYTLIVSQNTGNSVKTFHGVTAFPVEKVSPTTVPFYEFRSYSGVPATLVGSFTLESGGNLWFTAKQLPPLYASRFTHVSFDKDAQSSTISFTTTNGVNYKVLYSTDVTGGWTPLSSPAYGDGTIQSITDYDASDPARFYLIESTY